MMLRRNILLSAFCASLACGHSGLSHANSRYPLAQRLRELSPDKLIMAGTYGMLLTTDRGKNWYYVCERTLFGQNPLPGEWVDPLFELFPDGTITSGFPREVRTSHDFACTWNTESALPIDPTWHDPTKLINDQGLTVDLALIKAKGGKNLSALVTLHDEKGFPKAHQLYESSDTAKTWQVLGKSLSAAEFSNVFTHDIAPTDARRIYVTGRDTKNDFKFAVSRDAGQTWELLPLPVKSGPEDEVSGAYIGGVTANPDEIYVRVNRIIQLPDGQSSYDDSLHYSNDAGKTWKEVLRSKANLLGFAFSPDYKTVLAGYGDPHIAPQLPDGVDTGIFKAQVAENRFEHIVTHLPVECLTWTARGVYVCANEYDPTGGDPDVKVDYHLGFAKDINAVKKKEDLEELLKLRSTRGPIPWANGKENECWSDWAYGDPPDRDHPLATVCIKFNVCKEGEVPRPVPVTGSMLCPQPGGGGIGGVGGGAGTAGVSGAGTGARGTNPSSCSCQLPDGGAQAGEALAALGVALALGLRRRRN